jgi:hypothetical protein
MTLSVPGWLLDPVILKYTAVEGSADIFSRSWPLACLRWPPQLVSPETAAYTAGHFSLPLGLYYQAAIESHFAPHCNV